MSIELTPEQRELESVARELLDARSPLAVARAYLENAGEGAELRTEVAELGWYTVGLADDDFGAVGLCILAEASGYHAAPLPLVDSAIAARLATAVERPGELVSRISAGELSAAFCALEAGCEWDLLGLACLAEEERDAIVLSGAKIGVRLADSVDALAVVADLDGEPVVAFLRPQTCGVSIHAEAALDPSSAPFAVELDRVSVPVDAVLRGPGVGGALADARGLGAIATAAEGLGAASRALDLAVEYSKDRQQFGRKIGSFQALQHLMADLYVSREAAWATILNAARSHDADDPDADETVAIAKSSAARASRSIVEGAIQVLGGIAFTWEHDVHLVERRALECEFRFGDASVHERALADLIAARVGAAAAAS
jgi:alkylation response protein AidB-like acyl-CoA dehydrogenase